MSSGPRSADVDSAGSYKLLIDQACDRFRRQWESGKRPRIEDFISQVPLNAQSEALRRLLLLEVELATASGEAPNREDWLKRFPTQKDLVAGLLGQVDETSAFRADGTRVTSVCTATRYRDLRQFQAGGMAELYLAHDEELHRDIILKLLRQDYVNDPKHIAQFAVEARVTGGLDHPGIVPVYGIGQTWEGQPFYAMRMVRGRDLRAAIEEYHESGGPGDRSIASRKRLFELLEHLIAACNTVAFAHDAGVVHCDLKPANIMIGRYGETFVVDWGLARTFSRSPESRKAKETSVLHGVRTPDMRVCTPGYASPEQYTCEDNIQPASDIYSLGATLYHILTGHTSLTASDPDHVDRLLTGRYIPPRKRNSRIPKALEAICLRAMEVEPARRYRTAKELAADLQNWIRDEEIASAPDGPVAKVSRWARRHRGFAAASFLTTVAVVFAVALVVASYRETREQERLRRLAEDRLNTALTTFERLSAPLANEERNQLDVFQPMAKQILDFTTNYLADPQSVKSESTQSAQIFELRASVKSVMNQDGEALLSDLKRAEEIYRHMLSTPQGNSWCKWRLACNCLMQGRLLVRYGMTERAEQTLSGASELFQNLKTPQPTGITPSEIKRREAEVHHAYGELYLGMANSSGDDGFYRQSEYHFSRSRDLREELATSVVQKESDTIRRDLARSYGYLGDLYLRRGQISDAEGTYETSLTIRRSLYSGNSADPEHRFQYARGLGNFGMVEYFKRSNLNRAITYATDATEIQKDLLKDFPSDAEIKIDLAWASNILAELHLFAAAATDREQEKVENERKARELVRNAVTTLEGESLDNPRGVRNMALSNALRAELLQDTDRASAQEAAEKSRAMLAQLSKISKLEQDDYFTQALIEAVLGHKDDALLAIGTAVKNGSKTAERYRSHCKYGLKSVANDPNHPKELDEVIAVAEQDIID